MTTIKWMCLAVLLVAVTSSGCATITRGDKQKISFVSDPPNATLEVDKKVYRTPTTLPLKRKDTHTVVVSHDGYQAITFQLKSRWDAASLGNVIMPGGSVGFIIDTWDGADRSFDALARINLMPTTRPSTQPLEVFNYKGRLLVKADYDAALAAEKKPTK